ncbi:MAG: dihydroorotate dehydrogenase [Heliobacteriaceae bacterium]|nr:dihydroorotate dehydrogenase [Heliobacteriaceae bacterium]MDD4587456.1 dihydroorotate dehydrogenase [Heliobacteriaceae bacterium]
MVDLQVNLGGLVLKNPVTTASGTFGFGEEYAAFVDLNRLGAVTVKGLTLEPREGNPAPRVAETPAGMLNAIGLQNPGIYRFIREYLPSLVTDGVPVIVNINGYSVEEYGLLAAICEATAGVAALEVNISCPNVRQGGMQFGLSPQSAAAVTQEVRRHTRKPVIVKLSPNVTDITEIARAVTAAGADAVSLINTLLGMAIDVGSRRPVLANVFGGLSGPAVKPVALRMVYQVYQAVKVPILGMGGIYTAGDAVEFMMAGATAVAVGTANFANPRATLDILEGMAGFCLQEGITGISELTGAAH